MQNVLEKDLCVLFVDIDLGQLLVDFFDVGSTTTIFGILDGDTYFHRAIASLVQKTAFAGDDALQERVSKPNTLDRRLGTLVLMFALLEHFPFQINNYRNYGAVKIFQALNYAGMGISTLTNKDLFNSNLDS